MAIPVLVNSAIEGGMIGDDKGFSMRIARVVALAGIVSRRRCEAYIQQGKGAVNGEVVKDLGRQVNPEKDTITFCGGEVHTQKFVYFILHKPAGYTTTAVETPSAPLR